TRGRELGDRELIRAGTGVAVHEHVPGAGRRRGELAGGKLIWAETATIVDGGRGRAAGADVEVEVAEPVVDAVHDDPQQRDAARHREGVRGIRASAVDRTVEGDDGGA